MLLAPWSPALERGQLNICCTAETGGGGERGIMRAGRRRGRGEERAEGERVTRERGWRKAAEPHLLSGSRLPGLSGCSSPNPYKSSPGTRGSSFLRREGKAGHSHPTGSLRSPAQSQCISGLPTPASAGLTQQPTERNRDNGRNGGTPRRRRVGVGTTGIHAAARALGGRDSRTRERS